VTFVARRGRLATAGIVAVTLAALSTAVLLVQSASGSPTAGKTEIRFVDVGQGDGVVMRIGDKVIVSDAGQFNLTSLDSALHDLDASMTIDVVILSHPHSDHVKNIIDLVQVDHWKIRLAVLSHSAYWTATPTNRHALKALKDAGAELRYVVAGDHFNWGGADWEILNPVAGKYTDPYSPANASVAYRLHVRKDNILFTGDIGPDVAEKVAARWTDEKLGRATIFLATHHGSAEGSNATLLAATRPRWAVLSTGPNAFHHPTPAAIARLKGIGASICKRRYYCSGRKQGSDCDQPIAEADPLEEQLADYVRHFNPSQAVRKAVVRRLKQQSGQTGNKEGNRRKAIASQLERAKELYLIGDLTREQYDARKRVLEAEAAILEPPIIADISDAAAALTNFALFWERESDHTERNKILRLIFESVSVDDGRIVSVTPRDAFLPYFQFGQESGGKARERRDSNPRPPA
jgi:beta-lactamase superfamily II metal-dependent hydrolase